MRQSEPFTDKGVLCLYLFSLIFGYLFHAVLHSTLVVESRQFWGPDWEIESAIESLLINLVVVVLKPGSLNWSQWRLRPTGMLAAVGIGYLTATLVQLMASYFWSARYGEESFALSKFLATVLAIPILEEFFYRGVLLRSLLERYGQWTAIMFVALLAAITHLHFWAALLGNVALGAVYVYRKRSLAEAIVCHACINLLSVIPSVSIARYI